MARPRKVTETGVEMLPLKLLKNYKPAGDFLIDGRTPTAEEREKVLAGTVIELPAEEARHLVGVLKIAERADEY